MLPRTPFQPLEKMSTPDESTTLAVVPEPCKHADKPVCGTTCECWCDSCQHQYEVSWDKQVAAANLCTICGIPRDMTLLTLRIFEGLHFYRACPSCAPGYEAFMRQQNLCAACRGPVPIDGICRECVCTEEDDCTCRECRVERVKDITATSSGR
jgi:hypothetical protein